MSRVVFLLEESSMKTFLERLLPRAFPGLQFLCVAHEGKNDLEKSIPRKLRSWKEPGVRFVVVRDNDGAVCKQLKGNLVALAREGGREDTLIRIACQELEAWYFGDLLSLAEIYEDPRLSSLGRRARFRDSDAIEQPASALEELVPAFAKISCARHMGERMRFQENLSRSFRAFLDGVARLASG